VILKIIPKVTNYIYEYILADISSIQWGMDNGKNRPMTKKAIISCIQWGIDSLALRISKSTNDKEGNYFSNGHRKKFT
jgi:hypothetical protein